MVLDFVKDAIDKDKEERLITFKETDDFLHIWETDMEGNLISAKAYRKIKLKKVAEKGNGKFAEELIEKLEIKNLDSEWRFP